jgi:hypothetical protein
MAVSVGGVMVRDLLGTIFALTPVQAVEWTLYSTAVFLALCRFALHIHKKTLITLIADIWLFIAVLDCTALIACDTATYRAGAMELFDGVPSSIRKVRSGASIESFLTHAK